MHARNRTWPLGSNPAERCRQRTLPVEGGDGSTLSLDFTTGVLDPRLTFTRTSDATFINSSGLVQYADANLVLNSTMLVSTAWAQSLSGGGTATINGNNTVTFASTAGRATWLQTLGLLSGLPVTFSIEVTALTNTNIRTSDLFAAGFGFGSQVYNYTDTAGNTQTNIGSFTTLPGVGLYTITAVTTGTSNNIVFGTDCNGVGRTGTVTIARPQVQYGHVVPRRTYVPNSSTTAAKWDSPRFDHDPTTLAPRGLLIEGQVENRITTSESFSGWTFASAALGTTASGPDGNTSSALTLREDNTSNVHACLLTSRTVTSGSSATFSVFVKAGASPRRYILIRVNDNVSNANAASVMWDTQTRTISGAATAYGTFTNVSATRTEYAATSWDRIALTFTPSTATIACKLELSNNGSRSADGQSVAYLGDNSSGVLIWGAQLETGGASSYIPTGASQVTRTADNCSIVSPNFAPWYGSPTGWTVVAEMTPQSRAAGSFPGMLALRSAADSGLRIYYYNDGTYNTSFRFATASTGAEVFGPNGLTYGVPRKFGASVTSGTQFASSAGVQIGSTQTLAVPMDQTLLAIGSDGVSPTPNVHCRMHFRSIKYWPYAMTLADLNARTA